MASDRKTSAPTAEFVSRAKMGSLAANDRLTARTTARPYAGSRPDHDRIAPDGVYPAGGRVDTESSDVRAKPGDDLGCGA
jgi:hypothetical protein